MKSILSHHQNPEEGLRIKSKVTDDHFFVKSSHQFTTEAATQHHISLPHSVVEFDLFIENITVKSANRAPDERYTWFTSPSVPPSLNSSVQRHHTTSVPDSPSTPSPKIFLLFRLPNSTPPNSPGPEFRNVSVSASLLCNLPRKLYQHRCIEFGKMWPLVSS